MNRALEAVFSDFSRHATARTYYSYPEGSSKSNFVFRITYEGQEVIEDGRVILFFAPSLEPEPRFEAFDTDALRPIFAKDVVRRKAQFGGRVKCWKGLIVCCIFVEKFATWRRR